MLTDLLCWGKGEAPESPTFGSGGRSSNKSIPLDAELSPGPSAKR